MVGAYLVLTGFVLLFFALPMWLTTRRGRHVVGPTDENLNYDQPYPGLGLLASRKDMGDTSRNTRQRW